MNSCFIRSITAIATLVASLNSVASQQASSFDVDDMSHVQRVYIRFHGVPDLTGEYRVSAEGFISVPVVGRLKVVGIRPADLEQLLMKRGREVASRDTFAAVEIVAYKPVFVTGFVSSPGATEWRPGMTVLHAIALSGGLYRAQNDARSGSALGEVPLGQMTHLRKTLDDQKRALVTLAALRAEEAGSAEAEPPRELVELTGPSEAQRLVREYAPILKARRADAEARLSTVRRAEDATQAELKGLQQQRVRIQEQLKLRQSSREKLEELLKKGLVRSERTLEETIKVSELEEKLVNIGVAISRVQVTLAGLERDLLALGEQRRLPLKEEIQRLERLIAQGRIEVEGVVGAQDAFEKRSDEGGRRTSIEIGFRIMRANRPEDEIRAAADTKLWPGDVLTVTPRLSNAE